MFDSFVNLGVLICGGSYVCSWNFEPFFRRCGWIESLEGFACRYQLRPWLLLELMTEDTGIGFPLKSLG